MLQALVSVRWMHSGVAATAPLSWGANTNTNTNSSSSSSSSSSNKSGKPPPQLLLLGDECGCSHEQQVMMMRSRRSGSHSGWREQHPKARMSTVAASPQPMRHTHPITHKQSVWARFKEQRQHLTRVLSQYGKVGVGVYSVLSLTTFSLSLLLLKCGLVDLSTTPLATNGGSSTLLQEVGLAYLLHKTTLLARIPLTVAITPVAARKFKAVASHLQQQRFW